MKKMIPLLLVVVMLVACMATTVFAAKTGETVTVDFVSSGNPGFGSYNATVSYDTTALELVSIEEGALTSGKGFFVAKDTKVGYMGLNDVTGDGILFTATFKVLDAAKAGETYSVTAAVVEGSSSNVAGESVTFTVTGGSVTVDAPVHEHTWSDWKVTTAATCDKEGVETRTCACGESETRTVAAIGHAWGEWKVTTAATCTEKGVETRVCANDASHTETRGIAAKGHTYGDWTVTKAPTCTEKGVETRKCACGAEETREVAAKGHTWGEWTVTTKATCGKAGVETRKCACGAGETREIAALEHVAGDPVKENYVAATETTDGSYDLVVYCTLCGEELSREHVSIPALGLDDEPNTGDFTVVLAMVAIVILMVPCLLVGKFRTAK